MGFKKSQNQSCCIIYIASSAVRVVQQVLGVIDTIVMRAQSLYMASIYRNRDYNKSKHKEKATCMNAMSNL